MKIANICFSFFVLLSLISCGGSDVELSWKEIPPVNDESFKVNFYVENSGSMNGYMNAGSEFENAVHFYANELDKYADTTRLFFINSKIIPFTGDINAFTLNMTPSNFSSLGGNTSSSSIDEMMNAILEKNDNNTVSVFVSDCILAVPFGVAQKFFSIARDNVNKVFWKTLKKHDDLGVEIFCLKSDFNGNYYQWGKSPVKIHQQRPYYMWVIGPQKILGQINKHIDIADIPGGDIKVASYSSAKNIPFTIVNTFGTAGHSAGHITVTPDGAKAHVLIRADLSSTLLDNNYLSNKNNYTKKSPLVQIENVKKISYGTYTHEISLAIMDNAHGSECIKTGYTDIPEWVENISSDDGGDLNKTSGIKYIVSGVADAYKNLTDQSGIKFEIK